jgi:regulatory protein
MTEDRAACAEQALGLLARREHSRVELERKLAKRRFDEATIVEVLDRLEATGALAAGRFAESFLRSRIAKGQGPARIRMDLKAHGIDPAESRALLEDCDWEGLACEVRRKRFGVEPPADYTERARQMRFLQYRGFEFDHIRAALDDAHDSD